jgi:hypothetical protein
LQVKKVLPAIMLVAPYSAYADEQEWGQDRELILVDWDSQKKQFLVTHLNDKGNYTFEMRIHGDFTDEYSLTDTGSRWQQIIKYATIPSEFKPGKFLYTEKRVELLKKKQASEKPKVWVQFGKAGKWDKPCRSVIEWKQPEEEGETGICFNGVSYPFYDDVSGFYSRRKGSEHVAQLVSRVKLVEKKIQRWWRFTANHRFSAKNLRQMDHSSGVAWKVDLYEEDKKIGEIENDGRGGCNRYRVSSDVQKRMLDIAKVMFPNAFEPLEDFTETLVTPLEN